MVTEEVMSIFSEDLILQLASLNVFLQAIGGLLLFYILFNIIIIWFKRKERNHLKQMDESLSEIKSLLAKQNSLLNKKRNEKK